MDMSLWQAMQWPAPVFQLVEFTGTFLGAGAVGFRYAAMRGAEVGSQAPDRDRPILDDALQRAAVLGLIGAVLALGRSAIVLPSIAARQHTTLSGLIFGTGTMLVSVTLMLLAFLGFLAASRRIGWGWGVAAVGVIARSFLNLFSGNLMRLVNPLHMLTAGLWIGTLFVLAIAGIGTVLRHPAAAGRRGPLVAAMVHAFSPLALTMGGLLVLSGVITAWNHLPSIDALWTTVYGAMLFRKLIFVAMVFALGAWNWRRQRPTLGSEEAARSIRRSAWWELGVAGIVMVLTAILVSVPSPKEERESGTSRGEVSGRAAPAGTPAPASPAAR